ESNAFAESIDTRCTRRDGKMLPHPRQVGEAQIDHLHLLVPDRLHEIFGCRTLRKHGFTPGMESRNLGGRSAAAKRLATGPGSRSALPRRQPQLWWGPRMS